jgi:exo-beta-1,3-glucanase (GH17 family)
MLRVNSSIALALAVVTTSLWAVFNRPVPEPAWPDRIQGFSFSPFRADQDALAQIYPTLQEVDADLALLAGRTHAIRTYSVEGPLAHVPELAANHGINVALGVWLGRDLERNRQELELGRELAQRHRNVVRVVAGNEVLLRGDLSPAELSDYLDALREAVRQPVSTAEPWHVWLDHPELAEHVDYLAVHLLPYWEGIEVERAGTSEAMAPVKARLMSGQRALSGRTSRTGEPIN